MKIVGIDPGTEHIGIAFWKGNLDDIPSSKDIKYTTIEEDNLFGVNKLVALCDATVRFIRESKPEVIVIEDYGFGGSYFNVDVAELVGMIKLALKKIKIKCKVYFLAPNSTKMWVTGDGRAKKPEVVNCVKEILGLGKNIKVASHEADAMALIFTFRLFLIGEMDEKNCRAIKGRCYDN